jgi:2-polyprenyl-6-methoxyphenol hydroxylase-like FAD-dependent oxidoreductase
MHGLGAGITAARDMQEFMQVYDLTSLPYYIEATTTRLINSKWELLRQSPTPQSLTSWDVIYYRLRANFDGFRSGYCKLPPGCPGDGKASYMDGCNVTNLEHEDSLVTVQYQNTKDEPERKSFDLLIAADGSNSKIKQLLLPDIRRGYLYTAWRGTIPEDQISEDSRVALKVDPMSCVIDNSITVLSVILKRSVVIEHTYLRI